MMTLFSLIAKNLVRDVSAQYTAFQFFFNRSEIVADALSYMSAYFSKIGATINNFQLLNIVLPSDFNDAIQQTEVTRTKILQATVEQTNALVEAQTSYLSSVKQAQVIVTQSNATANTIFIQSQQDALARKATIEQELIALQTLKLNLNFTTDELMNYLLIDALTQTSAKITFAIDNPKFTFYT